MKEYIDLEYMVSKLKKADTNQLRTLQQIKLMTEALIIQKQQSLINMVKTS